jgi:2-polyprenyl-6-methoxyphenol hydroxylase-like FAD-dependent oxidoreductase
VDEWLAAPLPRCSVRNNWPERVVPVGNAAAALEPIGGEGMGLALRSAELAVEAIERATRTNTPLDIAALLRNYRRLWRWRSITCRLGAVLASRPTLSRAVVALLSADSRLSDGLLALTGKRASCR